VATVVSSGRGHVAAADGGPPENPARWGWEVREGSGTFDPRPTCHARGHKIGWLGDDREALYLDPDAAFAAVARLTQEQGVTYPLGQHTLWRRLKETGLLARADKGRATYWASVEGARRRVVHLRVEAVRPCTTFRTGTDGGDGVVHGNGPVSQQ
jgi:hypothetical protein